MERNLFGRKVHIPLNGLNVSRRLEFNLLMKYLQLKPSDKLLDVACGDGYWTAKMTGQTASVVGFDYNDERLLQAKKLAPGMQGRIRCDAHELPFASAAFDKSIGICVLEHFHDDVIALSELARVTKPGGIMAMTVDSFTYPGISESEKAVHAERFHVINHYTIESLTDKLDRAAMDVVEWTYLLRTPVSAGLYHFALKQPKLAYFIYPITYPVSLWSEQLSNNQTCGYKLAVKARVR